MKIDYMSNVIVESFYLENKRYEKEIVNYQTIYSLISMNYVTSNPSIIDIIQITEQEYLNAKKLLVLK